MAVLVAVEEETLALDDPAGPEGSTVAHLLAHASGLGLDGARIGAPGRRRIYSNLGFERLAAEVEVATGTDFAAWLRAAVFGPLDMGSARLVGSPASGAEGTITDLAALGRELLAPTLAPDLMAEATTTAFPGLAGVLPGYGRQDPNDWGLGFEIRDGKHPHWTGSRNAPGTFGHFGRSGTFLWVDPVARLACACLTDREFGMWAMPLWPELSDAILDEYA
jgi:CubicO group peptidase (beta-lactamase class C family)